MRFGTRLVSRTKRVAAKSIAAIPAESIPFIGVAVLIADTGYELYAACDLDPLYADLGMAGEVPDDALHSVCDPKLPDAGERLGWSYCQEWRMATGKPKKVALVVYMRKQLTILNTIMKNGTHWNEKLA